MAEVDIKDEINKITEAILGEEVRGSIKSALLKMNDELGKGATKVAPTEVDNASKCIAEGTFYKVLIDGTPSIITTSLNAGGATGVQYRFASTRSGSAGAIYYRTFTVNPFTAGEWINVSAAIDETTLEGIVDRYLETIGIDNVVERKENKKTYNHYNTRAKTLDSNVEIYIDKYPFTSMNRSPEVSVEEGDDSKYPSLKGMKQFLGACLFSMPEMFKNANDPDDTYSIQKAINYSIRTGIPFKCEKSKTYNISKPLYIRVPSDISLVFDFCNASLKCIDDQNVMPCILRFNRLTPAHYDDLHQSRVKITNVALDAVNEYAHTGLYIDRTVSDVFENISVFNARRGIYVSGGVEAILQNCYVLRSINEGNVDQIMIDYDLYKNPYGEQDQDPRYTQDYTDDDLWWNNNSNITACEYFSKVLGDTSRYDEEDKYYRISLEDGTTITDPSRTENVGIEVLITDSWVQNCVVINHTVGIAIKNGDTKILGCHPWVDNENVVKNATAYYNEGTNYYSDCTCDRFKIGFYCGNNAPMYLTNTHISSKPTSETIAAFETYCFYIPSTVYHNGSEIHAVNTKIHGIKDSWTDDDNPNTKNIVVIPKNWTNIPGGCISDINTSGYGVLNYLNSNLNNGETFKRIKQPTSSTNIVEGSINLLKCNGYDFSSQKSIVTSDELVTHDSGYQNRAGNIYTSGLTWATFKDEDMIKHCLYAPNGQVAGNAIAREIILGNFSSLKVYKKALISFRYETNWTGNAYIRVTNMSGEPYSSGILYNMQIVSRSAKLVRLLVDFTKNKSNDYADQKVSIVFTSPTSGNKFVNSKDTADDEYYFYFWEVNAFDLSNVPQYYLENSWDYARRLYTFIYTNNADIHASGVVSDSIIANLAASTSVDIRLKSEKIKLNLNRYIVSIQNTNPKKYENYIGEDASGYIIRYDKFGFPVIRKSNNASHQEGVYAIVPIHFQKSIGIFESQTTRSLRFMDVGEDLSPIPNTEKSALAIDITRSYTASNKYVAIKMLFDSTNNTKANIVSLRFGDVYLEPDTRLTAPGEVIKCYPEGEIYAVALNTVPDEPETAFPNLPTFAYTLEDI